MTERRARRKPGENRERLMEAGLIEFGLFGFHGASTAAIATRAGVPQPHLYANFSTKSALFVACCEAAAATLAESNCGSLSESMPHGGAHSVSSGSHSDASAGAHRTRSSALVLQAIAALHAPELSAPLEEIFRELVRRLGRESFCALFGSVALEMLEHRRLDHSV